jgi:hypothetical protein
MNIVTIIHDYDSEIYYHSSVGGFARAAPAKSATPAAAATARSEGESLLANLGFGIRVYIRRRVLDQHRQFPKMYWARRIYVCIYIYILMYR